MIFVSIHVTNATLQLLMIYLLSSNILFVVGGAPWSKVTLFQQDRVEVRGESNFSFVNNNCLTLINLLTAFLTTLQQKNTRFNFNEVGLSRTWNDSNLNTDIPRRYQVKCKSMVVGWGLKAFRKASELMLSFQVINNGDKLMEWVRVITPSDRIESGVRVGTVLCTQSRFYNTCLWSINPCRVTSYKNAMYDTKIGGSGGVKSNRRRDDGVHDRGCDDGFISCTMQRLSALFRTMASSDQLTAQPLYSQIAFTTLNGHMLAGEERFRVYYIQPTRSTAAPHTQQQRQGKVVFEIMSYSRGSGILGALCVPFIRPLQDKFIENTLESMRQMCTE